MKVTALVVCAFVLYAFGSPQGLQVPALSTGFTECYEVTVQQGQRRPVLIPRYVRLSSDLQRKGDGPSSWHNLGANALAISWSTGLGGYHAVLAANGSVFKGTAVHVSDYSRQPFEQLNLVLKPCDCGLVDPSNVLKHAN